MPRSAFNSFSDGLGPQDRQAIKGRSSARFIGTPVISEFVSGWIVVPGENVLDITSIPVDFSLVVTPGSGTLVIAGIPT